MSLGAQLSQPLAGLLVISIEQAVAAPVCTLRLADAGARVIKIEREGGETARHYDRTVQGVSAYFAWLNRGKESAVLDLKADADASLLRRMAARADVLVQNLAPGAARRLGFGSEEMLELNPRLICVDIVGYGQDTGYRDMRAYDMLVQAESGICAVTGTPGTACKVGVSVADIATGMNAHAVVLEALIERQSSGRGRVIEVAMFDGMADWMSVPLLQFEQAGLETARHGLAHAAIYPYRAYACRDGELVIAIQSHREWLSLCSMLERPELACDPRFSDNPARVRNRAALDGEIEPIFASLLTSEAIDRLNSHQIAWGRVSTVRDLSQHAALRRISVVLPDGEVAEMPRPAGRASLPLNRVPEAGAHTDLIRAEFAEGREP
jgi:itaconate CoA-transferase